MSATMKKILIAELDEMMQEWSLSRRDALQDYLYDYMANEFPYEDWDSIWGAMSEDELMEMYLNL